MNGNDQGSAPSFAEHEGRYLHPTILRIWHHPVFSKLTASIIVAAVGIVVQLAFLRTPSKVDNPDYSTQLRSLDKTRDAIQSLVTFIEQQKKQLQLSHAAVDALKAEQDRLHPLVEVDRKIINAMFAVQEARNQAAQARERWIGVGLGVLASLLASTLYSIVLRIAGRKEAKVRQRI
jgi:hypothetical protein